MQENCTNKLINLKTVQERVSHVINESPKPMSEIGREMDLSYHTIRRWARMEKGDFKGSELRALAKVLRINYEWLQFGKGPKFEDHHLNQIESAVNEAGDDYRGRDQTILNVELKAKSLIQDLQSLVDDIERMKRNQ